MLARPSNQLAASQHLRHGEVGVCAPLGEVGCEFFITSKKPDTSSHAPDWMGSSSINPSMERARALAAVRAVEAQLLVREAFRLVGHSRFDLRASLQRSPLGLRL